MLNCLIIEDEPLARRQIGEYVARIAYLKLAGTVRHPLAAKAILDSQPVDLLFLDIKMPHQSGIEFLKNNDIFQQVILITAFPEFAVEGFELEAVDYLTKPVTFERFEKAVEKAHLRLNDLGTVKSLRSQPAFLYVKHGQRYVKVLLSDILFVEAMLNYVNIYTAAEKYTIYGSLKNIAPGFPEPQFLRVHKSFLAAADHVDNIAPGHLVIRGYRVPLSKNRRADVLASLLSMGVPLQDRQQ